MLEDGKRDKKISVIIPCYNVARWVDRCLTSLMGQTIGTKDLEIICIDDASTDDTWDHLQAWEQRYPKDILLIRQEVNRRQGTARNIGLQYASGDWIAFVDADDWVEPDYLARLGHPASELGCDVACCGSVRDSTEVLAYFDQNDRRISEKEDRFIKADTDAVKKMLIKIQGTTTGPCAALIRKDLLIEQGIFFPEDVVYEDRFWPPLLYSYVDSVYFVEERLYHYFSNPHSTVYSEDHAHLLDWMTVQLMKWREYGRRGLLERYGDELEYDLLCDAVKIMTMICRNEKPSFSLYHLEKQIITERVPTYKDRPYFSEFQETARCMLEALYSPLDKEGFQQFHRMIKQMAMLLKDLGEKE